LTATRGLSDSETSTENEIGNVELYHYTTEQALKEIVRRQQLRASTSAKNPRDARYGDGVYLTDLEPGTLSLAKLSRRLVGNPFQGRRFSHFVSIATDGLEVIEGRRHVYVVLCGESLDLADRIVAHGLALSPMV
jgi:hypothetical protein